MRAKPRSVFYLNPPPCTRSGNHSVSLTTAIAIYFIIWWTVLFAVLPFGVRSQEESGAVAPGSVVFALCVVVYAHRLVTLDGLAALLGMAR